LSQNVYSTTVSTDGTADLRPWPASYSLSGTQCLIASLVYDGVSGGFCSQSRDTNGDARNNRASGTKTRGTDFWLLLPQLEGGQCGVKRVVRTTRDTFPARTMYPQGRH
ncbi:hypothetical protein JZ751_025720, partial [Albula glossodonta]